MPLRDSAGSAKTFFTAYFGFLPTGYAGLLATVRKIFSVNVAVAFFAKSKSIGNINSKFGMCGVMKLNLILSWVCETINRLWE